MSSLDHAAINLDQRWLDGYALEVYLLFQIIRCGLEHREVPCTKIYPPKKIGSTKMRPFIDWWDILKPVFLLGLGMRR